MPLPQTISPVNPKRLFSIPITVCLFVAIAVCGEPQEPGNEVMEIRSILKAQQDAWNRGNIDEFMNGYARSASTVFISGDTVRRGWESVHNRYKEKYSD